MTLADSWHDPRGPIRPEPVHPTAEDGVEFIRRGYRAALDLRFEEAAKSAGLSMSQIDAVLGRTSQD